jgi:sugar phosphate isomerase/epimerase
VAELQIRDAYGSRQRVGTEYDELLHVAREADIDVCWDLGHAFMNARRFGTPLDPPPAFLRRVGHVHCHDVREEDHEPLIHDTVPWRRQLEDLLDAGFDGTVILEVTPKRLLPAGGLSALERSLAALQHCQQGRPARDRRS